MNDRTIYPRMPILEKLEKLEREMDDLFPGWRDDDSPSDPTTPEED